MINDQPAPSDSLKNLRIVHLSMLSGLVFFAIIAYYIRNNTGSLLGPRELSILTYISLIFILIEIPLGYWLHSRKMKTLADKPDLNSKLDIYKVSHIVKIAMYEGAGFFSCLVLLLGGKNPVLIQILVVIIIMLLETPSATKLANDMDLSSGDKDLLDS